MDWTTPEQRLRLRQLSRDALRDSQLAKLNDLLAAILPANRFYSQKFADARLPLRDWSEFERLPYTFKDELAGDLRPGELAANLTWPADRYVRFHRTSGTRGRPLAVLDTADDWRWWIDVWQHTLDAAELGAGDRVVLAFSFGPFVGFWSAFDALIHRGVLVVPTGGLNTLARLEMIRNVHATAIFTTPSYALHMAESARDANIDLRALGVRTIVVAGEPGGSIAETRAKIETAWNARLVDHAGASEIGPWGYADREGRGLRIIESDFLAEFRSLETGAAAAEGELSELVLTTLGRPGCPIVRYRTGDLVRPQWLDGPDEDRFVLLAGGVLGRADDMIVVRGVNIFPSSIEQILHGFPEIVEWRMTAERRGALDEISIDVEDRLESPQRVARELNVRLGLKVDVRLAPLGSLPRFEGKGKRFIDRRPAARGEAAGV